MVHFSPEVSDSPGSLDMVNLLELVSEQQAHLDQLATDVTQMRNMMHVSHQESNIIN